MTNDARKRCEPSGMHFSCLFLTVSTYVPYSLIITRSLLLVKLTRIVENLK